MQKLLLLFAFFYLNLPVIAQTWEDCNSGRLDSKVNNFFIVDNKLYSSDSKRNIYYLNEDEISWTQVKNSISDSGLIYMKQVDDKLYAVTYNDGVYRSLDNGYTWQAANYGLPKKNWPEDFINIGSDLFLGSSVGLYYSSNFGANWSLMMDGLPGISVVSLVALGDTLFTSIYMKGVYKSTNKGLDWTFSGLSGSMVYDMLASDNKVYASDPSNNGGLSVTENGGLSWAKMNAGMEGKVVRSIARSNNIMAIAAFNGGVFVSYNEGIKWNQINYNLPSLKMYSVAFWKNYLYAGSFESGLNRLNLNLLNTEELNTEKLMSIFPNPASDYIFINLNNFNSKFTPVTLKLINYFGEIVIEEQIIPDSGKPIRIDTKDIAEGMYFLMLKTTDKTAVSKVIITK